MAGESHACKNAPHKTKALYDAWHWIVAMNLIFEIDKTLVLDCDEGFEYPAYRHDSVTHVNLAVSALKICKILYMHVEQAWSHFVDSLNDIRTGTHSMAYVDAASHTRVHVLYRLQHIQR